MGTMVLPACRRNQDFGLALLYVKSIAITFTHRCTMSRREAIFFLTGGNNPERPVRQRLLKRERLLHGKRQPLLDCFSGGKNDRHGFGMDRAHFGIRVRGQKPE